MSAISFSAKHDHIGSVSQHLVDAPIHNEHLRALWDEPDVRALAATDIIPIPKTADRENYYNERHLEYWLSGLSDKRRVGAFFDFKCRPRIIYELGSATGRVIRHFHRNHEGADRLIASDVNAEHVAWMQKNCPAITTFVNTAQPTLPLRDRSVDLVMAFSVFTHIDELEMHWLLELSRVVKRSGTVYVTVQTEDTWAMLPKMPWMVQAWSDGSKIDLAQYIEKPMPAERIVLKYNDNAVYNCNVVVSNDFIRRTWSQVFGSVEIVPLHHGHQSAVVLRKPLF